MAHKSTRYMARLGNFQAPGQRLRVDSRKMAPPGRQHRIKGSIVTVFTGVLGLLGATNCQSPSIEIPPGQLARVGETLIGPQDLADVLPQLGAYARARFRGPQGSRVLLDSLVDLVVLEHAALDADFLDSPSIRWGVIEELANLELAAELERRATRNEVAEDREAQLAYYRKHIAEFSEPEKRNIWFVSFPNWTLAAQALDRFKSGEIREGEQEQAARTVLAERNDRDFPFFHALLFDPELKEGDWLARPVMAADYVMVAKVDTIEAGRPKPFEDAKVQEHIINALMEPRIQLAKQEILQELALRYEASDE